MEVSLKKSSDSIEMIGKKWEDKRVKLNREE